LLLIQALFAIEKKVKANHSRKLLPFRTKKIFVVMDDVIGHAIRSFSIQVHLGRNPIGK
jgi:hypothetical protein